MFAFAFAASGMWLVSSRSFRGLPTIERASERASPRDRAGDDSIPLFLSDPMSNVCIGNCRRRDISSSSVRSFLPLCGRVIASWMEPGFLALASHATFVQSVGQGICCLSTLPLAAVVVEAASAAAYRWKLSNSVVPTVDPEKPLAVRPPGSGWGGRTDVTKRAAATVVSADGDEELTDRLLIGCWHSLSPSLPLSLLGLLECAPRMNGANSGQ